MTELFTYSVWNDIYRIVIINIAKVRLKVILQVLCFNNMDFQFYGLGIDRNRLYLVHPEKLEFFSNSPEIQRFENIHFVPTFSLKILGALRLIL